jgi:hypothetical protein
MARARRVTTAAGILLGITLAAACGEGAGPPSTRYAFTDEKGRKCSQEKYGLTTTCDRAAAPVGGCPAGKTACFVMYVPREDAGALLAPSFMWNCDACCSEGSSQWTGNTADCAAVGCTRDADCAGEDGTCEGGRCRSRRF